MLLLPFWMPLIDWRICSAKILRRWTLPLLVLYRNWRWNRSEPCLQTSPTSITPLGFAACFKSTVYPSCHRLTLPILQGITCRSERIDQWKLNTQFYPLLPNGVTIACSLQGLCETYEDKGSDWAVECMVVHALFESLLKQILGIPTWSHRKALLIQQGDRRPRLPGFRG